LRKQIGGLRVHPGVLNWSHPGVLNWNWSGASGQKMALAILLGKVEQHNLYILL